MDRQASRDGSINDINKFKSNSDKRRNDWENIGHGTRTTRVFDHILTNDISIFKNCQIKRPRFDTDHYVVKGVIKSVGERHHSHYVCSRQTYPIRKLKPSEQSEADVLLEDITERNSKKRLLIQGNSCRLVIIIGN